MKKTKICLSRIEFISVIGIFVFTFYIFFEEANAASVVSGRFPVQYNGIEAEFPYCSNYSIYSPNSNFKRLIISIHGDDPIAQTYLESAKIAAKMKNAESETLIIAPQFLEDDEFNEPIPANLLYWENSAENWGSQLAFKGPEMLPVKISTFAIIDMLLKHVIDSSLFPNIKTVILIGNSAGGQKVNRYAATNIFETDMASRKDFVMKYLVMAPSSYLYLNNERVKETSFDQFEVPSGSYLGECLNYNNYGYGLDNLYEYHTIQNGIDPDRIRSQYKYRNVLYLVGSNDTDTNDPTLSTTCQSNLQGSQRLERANIFYNYLKHYYGPQIMSNHRYVIVQGVGHNGRDLMTSEKALEFIFSDRDTVLWDIDINEKWSLPDIIYGLQVLTGIRK